MDVQDVEPSLGSVKQNPDVGRLILRSKRVKAS